MNKWQIILTPVVFLAGCQFWSAQQVAPAAPPYPTTGVPPVVIGSPYLQAGPMVQPGAPVPIYQAQTTAVPLPTKPPGSFSGPPIAPPGATPAIGVPRGVATPPQPGPPGIPAVVAGPPN